MQTALPQIPLHGFTIANNRPFVLFGGMNVLESRDLAMEIAAAYVEISRKLDLSADRVWKRVCNGWPILNQPTACR